MNNVSVLMCVYKEPVKFVREAINSIIDQTYTDYEFIIVLDDPYNVEMQSLLDGYANKDNRVRVIVNDVNKGLTKSLNIGLSKCTGKYIVRIDADDVALPERIETQVSYMEKHSNVVACGSSAILIDKDSKVIGTRNVVSNINILRSFLIFRSPIIHPSSIFRRVIDGEDVRYDEYFKYSQDYALWIQLFKNYDISNIIKPLIKYRLDPNQITAKHKEEQDGFSIANQKNALELFDLHLSNEQFEVFSAISKGKKLEYSLCQIESYFISIYKIISCYNKPENRKVLDYLLLQYCNYLPLHYNFKKSMTSYIAISKRINYLYFYGALSLINKFRRKLHNNGHD